VLVVVDPQQAVRLPRPIIIYPHRPFLPPETPGWYKIAELEVHARLIDQVAQVQVSQSFVNSGGRTMEVSFVFPLPYDGAVEQMTLLVDGREYPAKLLGAEEARRMYEEIVRKNRDPALLEWMGTGLFKTSVFPVPPGAKRTVTLRYSQLCRQTDGLTDFLFPLSTAKYTSHPVERVAIHVSIESRQDIKNVYSPSHGVEIHRSDDRHATVSYQARDEVPGSDFRLLYDVGQGRVSTRVLSYRPTESDDGYFLLLASPKIKPPAGEPPRKTVVFVMDRSGSMSGKKIEQVRSGLRFMLGRLHRGDLFNIIVYDNQVETFRPELQRFDDQSRRAAEGFIDEVYAGGSTDIDAALRTALGQLQDSTTPSYVIFLTDGQPTTGVTNEAQIVVNSQQANRVRARLFAFGVGYDVNSRLLDRLVRANYGQSEYVRPDEDIEDRVSRLYRRIESPVMTDVKIDFSLDESRAAQQRAVNRVYPRQSFDLFAGEQLVVVGRYKHPGAAKVTVRGMVGGKEQSLDFPAELVRHSADESRAFVEKLWAVRRIGEILDEIDLKGRNEELIKELVELSTRHGILTPYTSFLADESTRISDLSANARTAGTRLRALDAADGSSGFVQRAMKGSMQNAGQAQLGGMGGYGGGRFAPVAGPLPAAASSPGSPHSYPARADSSAGGFGGGSQASSLASADREAEQAQQTVRNVGNRAFYRRSGQWVDSTLNEKQQSHPQRIKQFSDQYFALAHRYGRQLSQYLVFDEPVVLNVEGQAYLIEP
jgi:Ca-activated chloride channel family protein